MKRTSSIAVLGWTTVLLLASATHAFNPPVDTAGPLTATIEGPSAVTQLETPIPIRVVLENKGDAALQGAVELKLVDAWSADPAKPLPFSVGANGKTNVDFTIIAGKKTYDVLYPLHAYVRFKADGKELVAHPVLIFEAQIAGRQEKKVWNIGELLHKDTRSYSGDLGLSWEPHRVAADSQLALWQLPLYRTVLQTFGGQSTVSAVAWQGPDPKNGANYDIHTITLDKVVREAVMIQPPWYKDRAGILLVEYPLELPKATPIRLDFAGAMEPKAESDGVTFRVRVLPIDAPDGSFGEVLFERHIQDKTWQPVTVDLSRFAGQKVRLQLEGHPGPKNDPNDDISYWAEPTLTAGKPASPSSSLPSGKEGSQMLGTTQCGGKQYEVRVWPGQRGLLDSVVGFLDGDNRLLFQGFQLRVLGAQLDELRSAITLQRVTDESANGTYQIRHRFHSMLGDFDVVGRLFIKQGVLRAKFQIENAPPVRPWIAIYLEDVAVGSWNDGAKQLYLGHGNVLRRPVAFNLPFEGHALVTSFVGVDFDNGMSMVQAVDVPPSRFSFDPASHHSTIHVANNCQFTFIPTHNAWEGARTWHDTNGLQAGPGVKDIAGRFCFDLWWPGKFNSNVPLLKKAFRYGLTNAVIVWHGWQRWGYDYRLPDIFPPDPKLGTAEEMRAMIEVCKKAGVPFATHDNYIEIYPDADDFSYEKTVAFSAKDRPIRGWCNEGRGAQSYRFRADCVEQFVHRNVKLIGEHLAPNAYFIDVLTSLSPHPFWTSDGRFFDKVYTRNTWRNIFAWIRQELGGNALQISESGHDQLIGYVDASQANHMGVGKPADAGHAFFTWNIDCEAADRIPWHETAHHDRHVLLGAGYSDRYRAGYDSRLHGDTSDDYLTTEVLTGRPALIGDAFGYHTVRTYWFTNELSRALALKRIKGVEFADGNVHRQHVSWTDGGEVWVNRGKDDWTVDGVVLPPYGFLARVPCKGGMVEAALCRRDGVITESAFSPNWLYVNGRLVDASSKTFEGDAGREYLARMNPEGKPIAFGAVTTSGGCRLSQENGQLLVTPLPESPVPKFAVSVNWSKLPWQLPSPAKVEAIDEEGKVLSTKPIERTGDTCTLLCEPGVFQYRLVRP